MMNCGSSINQYMEGIVCESDSLDEEGTRIAEKINLLKKEKFDGRIRGGNLTFRRTL